MKPQDNDPSLNQLVRLTLADLSAIRRSMLAISEKALAESSSQTVLDLELAGELKSVLDALRLLLWAYIRALTASSGRSPYDLLNGYKTELALEMLRSTRPRLQDEYDVFLPPSDFERLIDWAMVSVSRHPSIDKNRTQ